MRIKLLVALSVALAVTSCESGTSPDRSGGPANAPAAPRSPLAIPDLGSVAASPSMEYQPPPLEDPTDPVLIAYCSAQDRIVTLEGGVLSHMGSIPSAVRKMRQAQRAAGLTVGVFDRAGEKALARLAESWAESFDVVIARLGQGQEPIDALLPAIRAMGAIERRFSCELDG